MPKLKPTTMDDQSIKPTQDQSQEEEVLDSQTSLGSQPKKNNKKKFVLVIAILIVLAAFVWLLVSLRQAKEEIAHLSTPEAQQEINRKEVEELVSEVGQLINLPEGQPTVATIQDVEALAQQQPFFLGAQNGDKLLIYETKAIIYSPITHKLINVGPVYAQPAGDSSPQVAGEATEEPQTE